MRPSRLVVALLLLFTACVRAAARPQASPAVTAPPEAPAPAPEPPPAPPPTSPLPPPEPAALVAPEPPDPGPDLPAAPYLVPGAPFPKRAILVKDGPIRFKLAGDPLTLGSSRPLSMPIEAVVVEEHPRWVRLVLADGQVRLVAYAPRVSLEQVSTRGAWLAAAPDRAPDPAVGVRVAPGVALEEKERRGTLRRVAGEASEVRFEGWVDGEVVGAVFVPERFAATPVSGLVASGAVITAPSGDVIARFADRAGTTPMFAHEVMPLPGAPEGFQAIRFRSPSVEVRGLVPVAAYRKNTPGFTTGHFAGFGTGSVSDAQHAILRAGAGLFDSTGNRVGVALSATEVWVAYGELWKGERRVWAEFAFSEFGFVHAEVRSVDLKPYRDD